LATEWEVRGAIVDGAAWKEWNREKWVNVLISMKHLFRSWSAPFRLSPQNSRDFLALFERISPVNSSKTSFGSLLEELQDAFTRPHAKLSCLVKSDEMSETDVFVGLANQKRSPSLRCNKRFVSFFFIVIPIVISSMAENGLSLRSFSSFLLVFLIVFGFQFSTAYRHFC
jgi:hypothetical protein